MTPEKLAAKLKSMCDNHPGEKLAMIHLFGILYADQLENCGAPMTQIAKMAFPANPAYHAEVSKGKRLARYVQLKEEWAGHF